MTYKLGDIVTGVKREQRDMRIHAIAVTTVVLEWWDVAGRNEVFISLSQLNDPKLFRFVSEKPTPEFLRLKSVHDEAKRRHREHYPNGMPLSGSRK